VATLRRQERTADGWMGRERWNGLKYSLNYNSLDLTEKRIYSRAEKQHLLGRGNGSRGKREAPGELDTPIKARLERAVFDQRRGN